MTALVLVPSVLEFARLSSVTLPASVVLARVGVGLLDATRRATLLLEEFEPDECLLVGLAGSRDPARAAPGALVLGTAVRNEAIGAGHADAFVPLAAMGLRDEPLAPDLLALVDDVLPRDVVVVRGIVGSVAAASGSPAEARAWATRHPDVLVEEMEGYGVALACRDADVPLAIVRAVSNAAGDRDVARWELDAAFAALGRGLRRWGEALA